MDVDHDHRLSTEAFYRADFGPFTPGFRHFDFGDIDSLRAAITENTCAVLMEPIQGEAGIVVPPEGFLGAGAGPVRRTPGPADSG